MKFIKYIPILFSLSTSTLAQSFCKSSSHSGQSVKETSNKVGKIGNVGYELWSDSGNNSATFYSDGSFSCSFSNAKDYLCRSGLSFDSTKTHTQIGHIYADFKLVKQNISNVDYSYVGVYGWTRNPLVEYYVVDNWLSPYRPGDWVGNKKHGDFTIDGAQYTVYENTRYGPSIDGNTQFKQYFSVRKSARDCGTIDITAHFTQWEKLGMKLGKMHEAKVLGEAGSNSSGTSGTADFPYAKVYVGSNKNNNNNNNNNNNGTKPTNNNNNNNNNNGTKTTNNNSNNSNNNNNNGTKTTNNNNNNNNNNNGTKNTNNNNGTKTTNNNNNISNNNANNNVNNNNANNNANGNAINNGNNGNAGNVGNVSNGNIDNVSNGNVGNANGNDMNNGNLNNGPLDNGNMNNNGNLNTNTNDGTDLQFDSGYTSTVLESMLWIWLPLFLLFTRHF